jgi:alpha-tubulin suppressor-like RCC1 family protein
MKIAACIAVISLLISGCGPARIVPFNPSIAAGGFHTCALSPSGGVRCWGDNEYGQLGDGTTTHRRTPVDVVGLTGGVSAIAAGMYHTCAAMAVGGVKCWGENRFGGLGDGTTTQRLTPVDVIGLKGTVSALAAGWGHTCAAISGGGVKCWGDDRGGQLGDGMYTTDIGRLTPVDVIGLKSGVSALAAAEDRTCAVTSDGEAKCWGAGFFGELGNGSASWSLTPGDVRGLTSGVSVITAGDYHTCAVTSTGGVKCWGLNDFDELGIGESNVTSLMDALNSGSLTSGSKLIPVDVIGLSGGVKAISAGGRHTCVVTSDGGVKCWGDNRSAQLGDGTIAIDVAGEAYGKGTPVDVSGLASGVIAISAGDAHTCALTLSGDIKCWGSNFYGQLGDGTTTRPLTPVDVLMP